MTGEVGSSEEKQNHVRRGSPLRSLSAVRVLIGLFVGLTLVLSAVLCLCFCAPITSYAFRLISVPLSRKATGLVFGYWLCLWVFFFEKINGTRVVFSGEHVPDRERVIVVCNHRTEVDWMFLWNFAYRKKSIGWIKYVMKSQLRTVPVFGWAFHMLEFLFLERNWENDRLAIAKHLDSFKDRRTPIWLSIFPEGTDFSEAKKVKCNKYAKEHGLPESQHLLLPRTKGFIACLEAMRNSIDAVYDLTIAYKDTDPTLLEILFGVNPREVHVYVKRVDLGSIPADEDKASAWLYKAYQDKDNILKAFYANGRFPAISHGSDSSQKDDEENHRSFWLCGTAWTLFPLLCSSGIWLFLRFMFIRMWVVFVFVVLWTMAVCKRHPPTIGI